MTNTAPDGKPAARHRHSDAASTAPRSESLPRWQLKFTLGQMVAAETIAAAVATVLAAVGVPWWGLIVSTVVISIIATVNYRGATAVGWISRAVGRRTHRSAAATTIPEAFSAEMLGVGAIGMRWD